MGSFRSFRSSSFDPLRSKSSVQRPSIAVLQFQNMSGDPDQEYDDHSELCRDNIEPLRGVLADAVYGCQNNNCGGLHVHTQLILVHRSKFNPWGRQSFAFIMAAMVAPCERWSSAGTLACFD